MHMAMERIRPFMAKLHPIASKISVLKQADQDYDHHYFFHSDLILWWTIPPVYPFCFVDMFHKQGVKIM